MENSIPLSLQVIRVSCHAVQADQRTVSFQHLVNHTFSDMVDWHVIAYLDDILVYSPSEVEHERHVRATL